MPLISRSSIPEPNESAFVRASRYHGTFSVHGDGLDRTMVSCKLVLSSDDFLMLIVKVLYSNIANVLKGGGNTESSLVFYLRTCV